MNATADSGKNDSKAVANTAVKAGETHGDHDRVAMLSLKADGTPDQFNPEIIGDKEFAQAATREQFTQQAVSAADQARTSSEATVTVDDGKGGTKEVPASELPQDPSIQAVQDEHEQVAKAAEKAADAAVGDLFKGDDKNAKS